ncbi:hypothetical protein Y1Q_0020605 [Alligator mississippiensis]|uniref:Maestro-like HEAT-repeats domain-containing protein n=1 Tax=Alligator mississippiensis TaxID=8496 RepID=A0A151NCP1_ALLMI|nr:hypothetical protein Y1Q_0020605 [Alligator mississippiensis]
MFTGVLAFAVQLLPQFEGSPDIPEVGDMAACLGLMINDPEEITSCKARAGMYLLTQILLHQRGKETQLEYKALMPMVSLQKPGPRCGARRCVPLCPFPAWEILWVSALMNLSFPPQRQLWPCSLC